MVEHKLPLVIQCRRIFNLERFPVKRKVDNHRRQLNSYLWNIDLEKIYTDISKEKEFKIIRPLNVSKWNTSACTVTSKLYYRPPDLFCKNETFIMLAVRGNLFCRSNRWRSILLLLHKQEQKCSRDKSVGRVQFIEIMPLMRLP